MTNPTYDEIQSAVADAEGALMAFTGACAFGSLGELGIGEALDLTSRASASVKVAANAFGEDASPDDTPDDLQGRMMGVYVDQLVRSSFLRAHETADSEQRDFYDRRRSAMAASLGLSDDDVAMLDFDEENGDPSPWLKMKEEFTFG